MHWPALTDAQKDRTREEARESVWTIRYATLDELPEEDPKLKAKILALEDE